MWVENKNIRTEASQEIITYFHNDISQSQCFTRNYKREKQIQEQVLKINNRIHLSSVNDIDLEI